jgi:hypothetical protein
MSGRITVYSIFLISSLEGQIYLKNTGFPSPSVAMGSVSKSMFTVPAMAKATTRGGEARKLALVKGCTLPSKFLFPLKTEEEQISFSLMAS